MTPPRAQAEVVGEILSLPVESIDVGDRIRPVDPTWAQALAGIIKANGQNTPIEVCRLPGKRTYLLVSGAHRLAAIRIAGIDRIIATLVENDPIDRMARETSENLWRSALKPMERAAFIDGLITVQRARAGVGAGEDGRRRSAQVRWQRQLKDESAEAVDNLSLAYGWADVVADHIGMSRKTVYRDLVLRRRLEPDVAEALRHHNVGRIAGQLHVLAKQDGDTQRRIANLLLEGHAQSVSAAIATLQQRPKPSPETKAWSAFIGSWARMSAAKRKDALRELEAQGLPKGVRLVFDGGER